MTKAGRDNFGYYEDMYNSEEEPFRYSVRAGEVLRHEKILELVRALAPRNIVEIGCSLGLLTERLLHLDAGVTAIDLSPTAVLRARKRLAPSKRDPEWLAGSVLDLPLARSAFDLALASDGPMSWYLSQQERARAYQQIHDVLTPGGHAIITEYLRAARFQSFVSEVRASPLEVLSVSYLYNRPWYQLERNLNPFAHTRFVTGLMSSVRFARALGAAARLFGRSTAHHILVTARRPV